MRILTIDIETRPNLAYVWGVWEQNIAPIQVVDEKDVISFAAKWRGEGKVKFASTYHHGKADMIAKAHALLDEADAVVTYNGKKFDLPHLNLEFLRAGLTPPSPYASIDLLQVVRSTFKFTSNKLENVAGKLGIGKKIEHEGFALWLKCMADDADAWKKMREYNMHDVRLTEQLYDMVLPWIKNHPNAGLYIADGEDRCRNCGSDDLARRGVRRLTTGSYVSYRCRNCGAWPRGTKRLDKVEVT